MTEPSGGSGDAVPHPSLKPQVDNHLNNEELREQIEGLVRKDTAVRHSDKGNAPLVIMEDGNLDSMIPMSDAILNIINQEKAKLVEVVRESIEHERVNYDIVARDQGRLKVYSTEKAVPLTTINDILNSIKREMK